MNQNKKKLIIYLVLILTTAVVYLQVTQFDFIQLDDHVYVTRNINIQAGITYDGLKWMFQTRYADLWNPLVWLSFMFDYELHGLNPGGYHLTNLILHILSTMLLFWLFNRMTGTLWRSGFVAALFALHPLHVESVAWISERKDVLSAFFWILTLCFYVYYTEKPAVKRYLLVLCAFVLALMSKPMVVTLPLIMILLDYWPLQRFKMQKENGNLFLWQVREKSLFFILAAILVVITLNNPGSGIPTKFIPQDLRIANAPIAFVTYIGKTLWPADMAIYYPFPTHISPWKMFSAIFFIVAVSAAVIFMARRLPFLVVGWLWFTIAIMPVLGIIKISGYAMADHYHYIPSIGISIMLIWGLAFLFPNQKFRKLILFPTAIGFVIIMSILSWQQCRYWENSEKLFRHTLKVTKNNTTIHNLLGYTLFEKGNIREALHHYNKAILIAPDYVYAFMNRADAYAKSGQKDLALKDYNEAIRLNPSFAGAYFARGTFYGKSGQYEAALNDFTKTIALKPDSVDAYNNRGIVLNQMRLFEQAIGDFNAAIHRKPDHVNALNNRAFSFLNLGNIKSGCSDADKACKLGNCKTSDWAKANGLCR